jgi:HD-like signal output (HDOD) protein
MQPSSPFSKGQNDRLTPQDVLAAAQRLPTTAQVFAQINRMLDDPQASLEDVAELVRIEPVLSFRVLQLANGAFYGFRTPCSDLNEAIVRLGFREVNRLVGMVAAQHLCANFLSVYGISGELFWSDSLCSALATEWLTNRHSFNDVRTAYTAGLLRSVGKVVMHRILVDRPMLWRSYLDNGEGKPLLEWEREVFGLSSIDAAALLMQSWKMPPVLLDAIKQYTAPTGDEPLPYLLHLGAVVSAQINGALPGETTYWAKHENVLQVLEMDTEMLQSCVREVETMFERVKRAISI